MKDLKLNFHLWKLEKYKPNTSKKKKINFKAELNENGNKKIKEKIKEAKGLLFEEHQYNW